MELLTLALSIEHSPLNIEYFSESRIFNIQSSMFNSQGRNQSKSIRRRRQRFYSNRCCKIYDYVRRPWKASAQSQRRHNRYDAARSTHSVARRQNRKATSAARFPASQGAIAKSPRETISNTAPPLNHSPRAMAVHVSGATTPRNVAPSPAALHAADR